MEPTERVTLTNMCMICDGCGNVLVEEKTDEAEKGLIFPGGHVERHEAVVDSVVREMFEETGLTVSDLQLCGVKDWVKDDGSRYMVFLYRTSRFTGTLRSSEEGRVFWMPLDELRSHKPMWHLDQMLEIFCTDAFTELYFRQDQCAAEKPILK